MFDVFHLFFPYFPSITHRCFFQSNDFSIQTNEQTFVSYAMTIHSFHAYSTTGNLPPMRHYPCGSMGMNWARNLYLTRTRLAGIPWLSLVLPTMFCLPTSFLFLSLPLLLVGKMDHLPRFLAFGIPWFHFFVLSHPSFCLFSVYCVEFFSFCFYSCYPCLISHSSFRLASS